MFASIKAWLLHAYEDFKAWLLHAYEDFKAWRRGETRVSPKGTFGRVYARTADPTAHVVQAEPIATLQMTIHRADGSTEVLTVPATVTLKA